MINDHKKGFTLLEVMVVLVLIGLLAVVALNKINDFSKVSSELEILKSNLRYIQFKAMNDDVNNNSWGLTVSGNSYTLMCAPSCTSVPNLPNENASTHTPANGVAINFGFTSIRYNSWGSPAINGTNQASNPISISVTDGTNTQSFTITPNTGFIQ